MSTTESPPSPRDKPREEGETPRVAFFSADWCTGPAISLGGSDYWRLGLPAAKLYENGWDIKFARNLGERPDGRIAIQDPEGEWDADRDIIVLQRWMGEGTADKILRAREAGQVIINEIDDDYWNFPASHCALKTTDPEFNAHANREHYREIITASSLITVSTDYLSETLGDWGPPVRVVNNYIDTAFWPLRPPGDYVGWVGGLPWRGDDLELLRETVVPWLSERKQFFYHGGSAYHAGSTKIEDRIGYERVTTRPLTPIVTYPSLWEPLRVALIPIEDSPFNRAKSWVKGLEAASRGIPFIASDHAEYRKLGIGRIATSPEDWVRHLEALEDPEVYATEVATNRARAEALDIEHHWQDWAHVFSDVMVG